MNDERGIGVDVAGTLARRAAAWPGPVVLSADRVIAAGRKLAVRRRAAAAAAGVAALGVAAAGVGVVAHELRGAGGTAPVRLDVVRGGAIEPAGGPPVPLPAGAAVRALTRLPAGGWLVRYRPDGAGADELARLSAAGTLTALGAVRDARASADGAHVALLGPAGPVRVLRLSDLAPVANLVVRPAPAAPVELARFAGDWLALRSPAGGGAVAVRLWNYRTGVVRDGGASAAFDLAAGWIARRIDGPAWPADGACLQVVPVAAVEPGSGLCHPRLRVAGAPLRLSPDARWLTAPAADDAGAGPPGPVLLRVADVRAGRWQPVAALSAGDEVVQWVDAERYLVRRAAGRYVVCDAAAACRPLATPDSGSPVIAAAPGLGDL
ncbi:hypothetical protein GCM10010123_26110 [Pilimelia anulata]|uniref:Uncharacterized protein n=1 Tax=Pilimelia anulata TaxID=53371 RepID=A0A8J3BBR6_9ACTN|nr:hypothetical protein [Pilimelia anulata]GGJ95100.1 hypothetical protein GCM10010123_26110 [Pilimelia anulata]